MSETKICGVCKKPMLDDGWSTCHECLMTMNKTIDLMSSLKEAEEEKKDEGTR